MRSIPPFALAASLMLAAACGLSTPSPSANPTRQSTPAPTSADNEPTHVVSFSIQEYDFAVRVFDETGLVTSVAAGMGTLGTGRTVTANGQSLEITWISSGCDLEPIIRLARDSDRLLIKLEPEANIGPPVACHDLPLPIRVVMSLSETVAQEDINLEVR